MLCREEARDLCAAMKRNDLSVPMIAVCKEVESEGQASLGISDFEKKYYCGPVYHNPALEFYSALGSQKLGVPWRKVLLSPVSAMRGLKSMNARIKGKGIQGNLKGEGFLKGGVLVISRDDEVLFSYQEQTGSGISDETAEAIAAAARRLR